MRPSSGGPSPRGGPAAARIRRRLRFLQNGQEELLGALVRLDRSLAERLARIEHQVAKLRGEARDGAPGWSRRRPQRSRGSGNALPVVQPLAPRTPSQEELALLRQAELFSDLSAEVLAPVLAATRARGLAPGEALFMAGDLADSVHLVTSGLIELQCPEPGAPVALRGPGALLGETVVFTGNRHGRTARAAEASEVLTIPWGQLLELFRAVPEFALRFCTHFAMQLEIDESARAARVADQRLEGCLDRFDLASVLGSLLESDARTGVLTVRGSDSEEVGTITIVNGQPERARCRELHGEEAFHELMLMEPAGATFSFREMPIGETEAPCPTGDDFIRRPKLFLLLDASRLRDEVAEIRRNLFPDFDVRLKRSSDRTPWRDPPTKQAALQVWRLLGRGASVREILARVPRAAHVVLSILARLVRSGAILPPGREGPPVPLRGPHPLEMCRPPPEAAPLAKVVRAPEPMAAATPAQRGPQAPDLAGLQASRRTTGSTPETGLVPAASPIPGPEDDDAEVRPAPGGF